MVRQRFVMRCPCGAIADIVGEHYECREHGVLRLKSLDEIDAELKQPAMSKRVTLEVVGTLENCLHGCSGTCDFDDDHPLLELHLRPDDPQAQCWDLATWFHAQGFVGQRGRFRITVEVWPSSVCESTVVSSTEPAGGR